MRYNIKTIYFNYRTLLYILMINVAKYNLILITKNKS